MNREQMIKDREAFILRMKTELGERYPNAFNFYDNPENYTTSPTPPDWLDGRNSRKSLSQTKSLLTEDQLLHLLRRTKFGISQENVATFSGLDVSEIVNYLLEEEELAPPVNDYNNDEITDPNVPFGETFINDIFSDYEGERTVSLKSWFIEECKKPSTSMHSMMWLFWHNHMPVELWGIFNGRFSHDYLKLLHDFSFGNFKELVLRMTTNPAMLLYLNGYVNSKDAPDENYAREVQELFCIGKGPDANYTESDVQAAARLLTGWNIDWSTGDSIFYEWNHATEDKQFSEFYGNTLIEGKTGEAGAEELDDFIDMLFDTNEVASFICRKLYTFFVFSSIDDWTEENIIQPMAEVFRNNDYNVRPVLEVLLTSEHFYDTINYGAIIKSPADSIFGWWQGMNIQVPFDPEEDIYNKRAVNTSIMWTASNWGMQIGDPPNVAGWPAFHQFPTYDKTWITTSSIVSRIATVDGFLYWGFWSPNYVVTFDKLQWLKTIPEPQDPNAIIDYLEKHFLGMPIEQEVKDRLKGILLSGQNEDYYWTNAWLAFLDDESNETNMNIVYYRLTSMFERFFQLAEYQLK